MKRTMLWLVIAGVIVFAWVLYRLQHPSSDLNVEPHAAEEIEKAQRR